MIEMKHTDNKKPKNNFVTGESQFDITCVHGHETRLFNLGKEQYFACDQCKTVTPVGSLLSTWQFENEEIWDANYEEVKNYRYIDRAEYDMNKDT